MLIPQAFEYYDNQFNKFKQFFDNDDLSTSLHFRVPDNDMDEMMFTLKNVKTDKILLKGTYSLLGTYNSQHSLWMWGWAIPQRNKAENLISKKILNYALSIDSLDKNTEDDITNNMILKSELLNSKIYLENPEIEIEKYKALSLYLTKSNYIFKESVYWLDQYFIFRDIVIYED
jgi:hypothetical protein